MATDTIYYVYPQHHDVSFRFVARQYVGMLRESLKSNQRLYEIPELNFYMFTPSRSPLSIIHPFFYSMYHWKAVEFSFFEKYRAQVSSLLGIEVADTDQISSEYIGRANDYADAMIVNSEWSRNAFMKSGLLVPIHVVSHAYDPLLEEGADFESTNKQIQFIKKLKDEKHFRLIMTSLWHSDYRKGADLFREIALRLQKERDDVYFLVKSAIPRVDMKDVRMLNVTGIVPFTDMIAMYRLSDAYLLPSRGGSFELNCLEALVTGIPCISTEGGAWDEFYDENTRHLLVKSRDHPIVLQGNRIHVGRGVEMDVEDAVSKLHVILDRLDEEREKVKASHEYLRRKYGYTSVKRELWNVVEKYMVT